MEKTIINYQVIKDSLRQINSFLGLVDLLPKDLDSFQNKFGTFSDKDSVSALIKSVNVLNEESSQIGDAEAVKLMLANQPDALSSSTLENISIYGQTIWLSNQLINFSATLTETVNAFKPMLANAGGDDGTVAIGVAHILDKENGLAPQLNQLVKDCNTIIGHVSDVQKTVLSAFVSVSNTKVLNAANTNVGSLKAKINSYQSQIKELKDNDSWFGRSKRKSEIQDLEGQFNEAQALIQKRELLVDQLNTGFFIEGNKVAPNLESIKSELKNCVRSLSNQSSLFTSVAENSSKEQLDDYNWIAKAIDIPGLITEWESIKSESSKYSTNSLVD